MRSNIVAIARVEAEASVNPADPIEDRFRAAFKSTVNNWMAPTDEEQFAAGIEAVYLSATTDEQERILAESKALHALNAAMSGVPLDFEAVDMPDDPIGIMSIFRGVRGE